MKSLKDKLKDYIQQKQIVSYGEVCEFVAAEGYKVSTAERRLRELMEGLDSSIEAEMGYSRRHTSYIAKYIWKGTERPEKPKIILEGNKAIMIFSK